MSEKQPPQKQQFVIGPTTIMSPEAFAEWMPVAVSPQILTPERFELLKRMSEEFARNPAFLKQIEQVLADYGDEIYRISPSQAELEAVKFGWTQSANTEALVPPAAAAAALAPAAAALAAAHAPAE